MQQHPSGLVVRLGDFADARVQALLRHHLEGLHACTPAEHVFALDWSGLQKPDITFWTIWEGTELLGCGALKELSAWAGEVKSMRTWSHQLRRGAATHMLLHIIATARGRGYEELLLETGRNAAFEPALALYRQHGFVPCGAFGNYAASEYSQFLRLQLAPEEAADHAKHDVHG